MRAREIGIRPGVLPVRKWNAISDGHGFICYNQYIVDIFSDSVLSLKFSYPITQTP